VSDLAFIQIVLGGALRALNEHGLSLKKFSLEAGVYASENLRSYIPSSSLYCSA
jgi:hypothetical protein